MKRLLTIMLVLTAAVFAQTMVQAQEKTDDKPPYYLKNEDLDKKLGVDEKAEAPETYIWLVYFHRVPGCATCQLMSKYIYEAVDTKFKEDVKTKGIVLRYQNFEDKKNAELVKKLKVQSPSLAIIVVKDGKLVKAKMAGQIWSLAGDKKKFIEYVEKEISVYKTEIKEAEK